MRDDWDARARENARHFVQTGKTEWTDDEFFASGETSVDEYIRNDLGNICQGRDPNAMRVLEIGCGAGRVTRALARLFGEVHGVDISGEMIERARAALAGDRNSFLYQNNGMDLSVLPALEFDFAFSMIVFQHIPSKDIVESYFREVSRMLRPEALFKVQVHGSERPAPVAEPAPLPLHWRLTGKIPLPVRERYLRPLRRAFSPPPEPPPPQRQPDTWTGVRFSPEEAATLTERCGFELRHTRGEYEPYYWWWCFKLS